MSSISSFATSGGVSNKVSRKIEKEDSGVRVIRRYQNRKLYDTFGSSYVTLDGLALMIQEGCDIQVIDNQTHVDITSVTLTQIIFENERKASVATSIELLHDIIRSQEGTFGGYVHRNTSSALPIDLDHHNAANQAQEISAAASL